MNQDDAEKGVRVQFDQLEKSKSVSDEVKEQLKVTGDIIRENAGNLEEIDQEMGNLLAEIGIDRDSLDLDNVESAISLTSMELDEIINNLPVFQKIDTISFGDFDNYIKEVNSYAQKHNIDFSKDPFDTMLSPQQREDILKRIDEDYKLKKCNCDKYDYLIAATCGAIGGLIDAFFVGVPGQGALGKFTDKQTDNLVHKFSDMCGWKGPREGSDPTSSAIGHLEKEFKVNYDHRHGGDVDHKFKMSTRNHHLKSLGHSPSIVGLVFSILDQFTSAASFVSDGKIIRIRNKETFELEGSDFISKVFAGFCNWFGHIISDVAGSSGAAGRGSGVPVPFYELLQFANFGEFGQHRQTFATICVQVYEQGYDLRHGMAMAIPVIVTELLVRITWTIKGRFYHKRDWKECIPFGNIPELNRMLLVGHGSLCLVDLLDASLKSGGTPVALLLRMNIIAWVRFGYLGLKEVRSLFLESYDIESMDRDLEIELQDILSKQTVYI